MKEILCLSPSINKRTIHLHMYTSYIYELPSWKWRKSVQKTSHKNKTLLKSWIGRNDIGGYFDQWKLGNIDIESF